MCAIRNGQSIDTSMGLTPLSGLPGATRAGDIDASLIFHYTSRSPAHMSHDPSISKEVKVTEVRIFSFVCEMEAQALILDRLRTSSTSNQVGRHSPVQPTSKRSRRRQIPVYFLILYLAPQTRIRLHFASC